MTGLLTNVRRYFDPMLPDFQRLTPSQAASWSFAATFYAPSRHIGNLTHGPMSQFVPRRCLSVPVRLRYRVVVTGFMHPIASMPVRYFSRYRADAR